MTHSGGKPHPVGYKGQRYEISVFDEESGERMTLAWSNDRDHAERVGESCCLRPGWSDPEVKDLKAKFPKGSQMTCPQCGKVVATALVDIMPFSAGRLDDWEWAEEPEVPMIGEPRCCGKPVTRMGPESGRHEILTPDGWIG